MFLVFLRCLSDFLFVYKLVLQVKILYSFSLFETRGPPVEAKVEEHDFPES